MGIEIQLANQGKNGGQVRPGDMATFTFQNPVQAYVLGISSFCLKYSENPCSDHYVLDFGLRFLPSEVAANQVTVQVEAVLQDSSGNTISSGDSYVTPACVAITGPPDPRTTMGNKSGIADGAMGQVPLPGQSGFSVLESFLSGFDLRYQPDNHAVLEATMGCGISPNGSQGSINVNVSMQDSTGHSAQVATVDTGYIASTESNPGFQILPVHGQYYGGVQVFLKFDQLSSVSQAIVLLKTWQVRYPDYNHNVKGFTFLNSLWLSGGNEAVLDNLTGGLSDCSGHIEDTQHSSVTVLVIAVP